MHFSMSCSTISNSASPMVTPSGEIIYANPKFGMSLGHPPQRDLSGRIPAASGSGAPQDGATRRMQKFWSSPRTLFRGSSVYCVRRDAKVWLPNCTPNAICCAASARFWRAGNSTTRPPRTPKPPDSFSPLPHVVIPSDRHSPPPLELVILSERSTLKDLHLSLFPNCLIYCFSSLEPLASRTASTESVPQSAHSRKSLIVFF